MSSKEELAAMEEDQLAALEEIASIKEQIARAKARAAADGEYSDADWYQRANRALRHKQIEHQSLMQRTAELRKRLKQEAQQEQNQRFETAFIAAAKGMLDGDTFQRIVRRTNASLATAPGH